MGASIPLAYFLLPVVPPVVVPPVLVPPVLVLPVVVVLLPVSEPDCVVVVLLPVVGVDDGVEVLPLVLPLLLLDVVLVQTATTPCLPHDCWVVLPSVFLMVESAVTLALLPLLA